jgi:nucleotide-binding universal stress UspA family protein
MKKILVPTDFSVAASKAVTYATQIANKTGATIYLLHVIEPVTDSIRQPYALQERLQDEIANNRLGELNALQKNIAENYPSLKTETKLTKGTVIRSIHDFAGGQGVDLIIMGTTGATGIKEIFMGSVAAGTIGKAKIPVLTVPVSYELEEPDSIMFATNHFEENKDLLKPIVELANLYNATIHVAVFVDTDDAQAADYILNTRQLLHYMEVLNKIFPGTNFKGELLEGRDFETTIDKYDAQNEVDLIAMITYPKSFWRKVIRKSVTKKMAFHSTIPLLAIPAKYAFITRT